MTVDKILILGTGYTGRELARLAAEQDYSVIGTTRDDETADYLCRLDATAVPWSVGDDPMEWLEYVGETTTVVYSIPTLFKDYDGGDEGLARHVQPVAEALDASRARGARRFIYLSSSSVYGDHHGEWVDETTELRPNSPYGKMRADIESYLHAQDSRIPVAIARLVGIYGPNRSIIEYMKSGRYTLVDGGKKVTNHIHVHDIARVILAIVEAGCEEHRVYNITDGHPQPGRDVIEFVCHETGLEPPREETFEEYAQRTNDLNRISRKKNAVRVLNERIRRELDFDLIYPDVFAGYQAILNDEEPAPSTTTERHELI